MIASQTLLLLRTEFETDPFPTLSSFSCAVTRNLVTSEIVARAAVKIWQESMHLN